MNENHERGIYKIPKQNLDKFTKNLEKLSKKAQKLTGEKIYFVPFNTVTEKLGDGYVQEYVEVLLSGFDAPKLNGWSFVARLDHANEVGNIIRPVPGFVVPEMYRDRDSICDHCRVKRFRRDTYLVQNEDTGEIKQIGSTCLKDFLGHTHPEKIAKMAELLGYANEYARGAMEVGVDRRWIDLEEYLAHIAMSIRNDAYLSQSKAREINEKIIDPKEMVTPTSSRAMATMFPGVGCKPVVPADEHFERAQKAIEWAANLGEDGSSLNDYQHNIKVLAASGMIEVRSLGYASSIVAAYMRANNLFDQPEKKISNHVGAVGEKVSMEVEFVNFWERDNAQGTYFIYRFADDAGNVFTWMTGKVIEASRGDRLKLQGKVKSHDEYRGAKQTILSHCKVEVL